MTFDSPGLPSHTGVDSFAAIERLGPVIAHNDIRSVLADGDRVCVLDDFVTDTPTGSSRLGRMADVQRRQDQLDPLLIDTAH